MDTKEEPPKHDTKNTPKDPVVLSFEDSLVRESDLLLLNPPEWINDTLITFYFEYLKKTYEEVPHLMFITPEVTQCLDLISLTQYRVFLDPKEIKDKEFFFFALNDYVQTAWSPSCPIYGTHWSLVLISRPDKTVYHYDSICDANASQAEKLSDKVCSHLGFKPNFLEPFAVQQDNHYDCGIHLMCNADLLAQHLSNVHAVADYVNDRDEIATNVSTMRMRLRQMILGMAAEKKENNSS